LVKLRLNLTKNDANFCTTLQCLVNSYYLLIERQDSMQPQEEANYSETVGPNKFRFWHQNCKGSIFFRKLQPEMTTTFLVKI